jgi:GntR family L-lactate dehydrogenase operon transcriptional regulator
MSQLSVYGSPSASGSLSIEVTVLELLAKHAGPLGASVLQRILLDHGVEVGEATAGRFLRKLDYEGLTEQNGRLGRTLTPKGYQKLETLRRQVNRMKNSQRFLRTIDTSSPTILLDVLIGRRAIERETARLAATRATAEEMRTLQALFTQHLRQKEAGEDAVLENRELHLFIARTAKSRVLETALDLILAEASVSQVLIKVRREVGSRSGTEHPRIIEAVLARNAKSAEMAMIQHIDNIILDLYHVHGGKLPDIKEITIDATLQPHDSPNQQT